MVGACSLLQPYLCMQPMLQSPAKTSSFTSVNFHPSFPPLLVHQIIFTIPANILFLYTLAIFHLLLFAYKHPNDVHQPFCQFRPHRGTSGFGSLFLISPFFKIWTVKTGLTVTDSLSLSL